MAPPAALAGGRDKDMPPGYDPLLAFESLLERSQLNVVFFDRDLVVREASRFGAEVMRLSRPELRGRSLREILPQEYCRHLERTLAGETHEQEGQVARKLCQEELWTHVVMLPVSDAGGGVVGGMVIVTDVSKERQATELVEKLAFIDPLTELSNRRMVSMMLGKALAGAKAGQRQLALIWLNLDRFKDVNDALGHEVGDELLRAVGERLHEHVRTNDMVGRVGADDFLLVLPRISSRRNLESLIGRIHDAFEAPFSVGPESVLLTASCGVAVHPNGGSSAHELEEHAHTAMRTAKQLGGGACEIYEAGFVEDPSRRLRLVREIRDGIAQGHFLLHYQPEIDLQTMRVRAVEALARWQHPERGLLPPAEFIAFAEETALIVPLGKYLFEQACLHHAGWQQRFSEAPRLSINVSAREFQRGDVNGLVTETAKAAGVLPSALEIEITETAVLADPVRAAEVAHGLRSAGATIALDDFGTGYSSLTHLRELPIDRVKVDRSFVASCLEDRSASAILVGIAHIAHDLGMEVIAEGVETQAHLDFLRAAEGPVM